MKDAIRATAVGIVLLACFPAPLAAESVESGFEIKNVFATSTSPTQFLVTWDTNKKSDSLVTYREATTTPSEPAVVFDNILTKNHSQFVDVTNASSTFEYYVTSVDMRGNVATSSIYRFSSSLVYPPVPTKSKEIKNSSVVPVITKIAEIHGFNDPAGVSIHPNGNIYVANYHNDTVEIYSPTYAHINTLGSTRGSAPGFFSEPWDIAFSASGNAFITDTNNNRIQVFNPAGDYLYQFSAFGAQGLAINKDDFIYASGRQPEVFQLNGASLGKIPLGENYYPRNVALDEGNKLIFSNWGNLSGCCAYDDNSSFTVQTPKGEPLTKVILDYVPAFIDTDSKNRIWTADNYNNMVHVYDSTGVEITTFILEGSATGPANPSGLEVANDKLYVTSQVTDSLRVYQITK